MDDKRQLRAAVRANRAARPDDEARTAALTAQLIRLTQQLGAKRVASFVSVNGEPDTSGYLAWALGQGIEVLLPRVVPDGLLEWVAHEPGGLAPGAYGIPEPTGSALPAGEATRCDLLLIPAAAVDRSGTRLGWGKGFFDRELARLPSDSPGPGPAVFAVVFEDEIFERLPAETHDIPVHGAVTEERIHSFG